MSRRPVPVALRGRSLRLAPLAAALALLLVAPPAAPDPGVNHGHGKQATGTGPVAAVLAVAPGQNPGNGASSPGDPGATTTPVPAPAPVVAPEHAVKAVEVDAKHAAHDAEKAAKRAGKATERAVQSAPVVAAPSAASPPTATPPAVGDSATAAPTPAVTPAPSAAPVAAPAPAPATGQPNRRSARPPVRHIHRQVKAAGTTRRAAVAPHAAAILASPVGTVSPAPPHRQAAVHATKRSAHPHGQATPLTREVVRVLEVIPRRLRLAIAVLAALGLLLGIATAWQTVRARRLARQRRLLAADVGLLQSALLPALPRRIGDARVTAAYRPAEGLAAGGDFYDAFELPGGRTAVLVGDVAGHGREVVPLTALVRYSIRAYLDAGLAPRAALQVAAAVLEPQLGETLVTVIVAIIDPTAGKLTYACAGHSPPLLKDNDPGWITACSSPPIGAGVPTGRRQTTIGFARGDIACFATDGLADTRLRRGHLGEAGVAEELAGLEDAAAADELLARVVRRTERQPDDMAVCLATPVVGPTTVTATRLEELEVDMVSLANGRAERFLAACGVLPDTAEDVVRQAGGAIARTGSAVIAVRCGKGPARVKVAPRSPVALPLVAVGAAA